MAKYYIGFDCGTQSAKTALYRDDMVCMAKTQIATNLKCPKPEWLEMDVDDYLKGVIDGIKYCIETSGINPNDIRAICGDGFESHNSIHKLSRFENKRRREMA